MWAIAAHKEVQGKENDWGLFTHLETERSQVFSAKSKNFVYYQQQKINLLVPFVTSKIKFTLEQGTKVSGGVEV
jgi:hypothetical protein